MTYVPLAGIPNAAAKTSEARTPIIRLPRELGQIKVKPPICPLFSTQPTVQYGSKEAELTKGSC